MKHLTDIELVMALDGELEPDELKNAIDHLAECGECNARGEKLQGVSEAVAEYHAGLYSPVISRPSHGIRRAQSGAPSDRGLTLIPNQNRPWNWRFVAVAALVLISVGIAALNNSRTGVQPNGVAGGTTAKKHAPDVASTSGGSHPVATSVSSGEFRVSSKPKKTLPHLSKTPAGMKPDATLAQFTELPFSDTSLPLDDAAIVRVSLPAAALRQAGVAVEEDSANAMLQADLLLGMDGLPRGIRLVKESGANVAPNGATTRGSTN